MGCILSIGCILDKWSRKVSPDLPRRPDRKAPRAPVCAPRVPPQAEEAASVISVANEGGVRKWQEPGSGQKSGWGTWKRGLTLYDRFIEAEGIPVHRDIGVERVQDAAPDIFEVHDDGLDCVIMEVDAASIPS